MDGKTYLSLPEVSEIMHKSVQTLRRLIKRGDLNAKRIKTPQGFQYVVSPEILVQMGYTVLYNSPIQNTVIAHEEAVENVAPYQAENLYRPIGFEAHTDTDFYVLDIQESKMLPDRQSYEEKMFLFSIMERLQNDLRLEKEKKNVFGKMFKRLCNRIMLAIKRHSF